jgi:hypothetical protein
MLTDGRTDGRDKADYAFDNFAIALENNNGSTNAPQCYVIRKLHTVYIVCY